MILYKTLCYFVVFSCLFNLGVKEEPSDPKGLKWETFLTCLTKQGYFKVGSLQAVFEWN